MFKVFVMRKEIPRYLLNIKEDLVLPIFKIKQF